MRLFFALQPRPEQNVALVERVAPLVAQLQGQRVPAENLHATLCFIGEVAPEQVEKLAAAVTELHCKPAGLRFDTLEYWEKPRVLCATAAEDSASAPAHELARQLASSALAVGLAPDVKPFHAHLTLARKVSSACAASCDWPQLLTPPLLLHCDRFVLMESRRGESGSTYSVVASWLLDVEEDGDKSR